jgi:hypothetical protein
MGKRKKRSAVKTAFFMALPVVALVPALVSIGCSDTVSRETITEIDQAFRDSSSHIPDTTDFIDVLRKFDFQKADVLDQALGSIDGAEASMQQAISSLQGLGQFAYGGQLADLGRYISEYRDAIIGAGQEMDQVCAGIRQIISIAKPVFANQLSADQAKQSQAARLEFLKSLESQVDAALHDLKGLEVSQPVKDLQYFFVDLLTATRNACAAFIAGRASSDIMNPQSSPEAQRLMDLQPRYGATIDALSNQLMISNIDPYLEKVELEINRLYLGDNSH